MYYSGYYMHVFAFEEVSFRVKGNFFEAGSIATA